MATPSQDWKTPTGRIRLDMTDLRQRYSKAANTIWRWYTEGDFPRPHYLQGKRYWWLDEVETWEARQGQTYEERQAERHAAA